MLLLPFILLHLSAVSPASSIELLRDLQFLLRLSQALSLSSSFATAMAPMSTFRAFAVLLAVALFSAAASAQDPLSPAPAPVVGSAGAVSSSVALIGASVVLSMLAILKN